MEWISVIDGLPKHKQDVLIYNGEVSTATFNCSSKEGVSWEEPYYGQDMSNPFTKVTHWMSIPKPPKENKQ